MLLLCNDIMHACIHEDFFFLQSGNDIIHACIHEDNFFLQSGVYADFPASSMAPQTMDYSIAQHIIRVHQNQDPAVLDPPFTKEQMQRYIRFARRLNPVIGPDGQVRLCVSRALCQQKAIMSAAIYASLRAQLPVSPPTKSSQQ